MIKVASTLANAAALSVQRRSILGLSNRPCRAASSQVETTHYGQLALKMRTPLASVDDRAPSAERDLQQ